MVRKHELVTQAARDAGRALERLERLDAFSVVEALTKTTFKDNGAVRSDEAPGSVVGIRIVAGRITDVLASNGAVRIEG